MHVSARNGTTGDKKIESTFQLSTPKWTARHPPQGRQRRNERADVQILSSCPGAPRRRQKKDGTRLTKKRLLYIITCVLGRFVLHRRYFLEILPRTSEIKAKTSEIGAETSEIIPQSPSDISADTSEINADPSESRAETSEIKAKPLRNQSRNLRNQSRDPSEIRAEASENQSQNLRNQSRDLRHQSQNPSGTFYLLAQACPKGVARHRWGKTQVIM